MWRSIVGHLSETGSRYLLWGPIGIVGGLFWALSEWLLLRNPGVYGTIAALAGSLTFCFGYGLIRGRPEGSQIGLGASSMAGGMAGAKGGSILLAISLGLIGAVLCGLLARLASHFLDLSRDTDRADSEAVPRDFGELERHRDEVEFDSGGPRPTRAELNDRSRSL